MRYILSVVLIVSSSAAHALDLDAFEKRPKLVVALVIDQFRADYLTRFADKFKPAGSMDKPGGFRFLMKEGAYFPAAEYDVLQNMTCSGHAAILSGTRPARFGFATNDWFEKKTKKMRYCAQDDEFGVSPRQLGTTTVGDELKNVHASSRVVAIALKDRSAIMLGGHRADVALWVDPKITQWSTSKYYGADLPAWASKLNAALKADAKRPNPEDNTVESGAFGVKMTFDAAITAVHEMKLGHGKETDILAVSLSNHDMLGHMKGPNSPEMEKLTLEEDRLLAEFLGRLRAEVGSLKDVVITFTADHGASPAPDVAKTLKLESGRLDFLPLYKKVNARLDEKFGSAGQKEWIVGMSHLHFFLNDDLIAEKKAKPDDVENEVRAIFEKEPGVADVYTRGDYNKGLFPPGPVGEQLKNSYIPGQSGDVVVIPKPFFMAKGSTFTNHISSYAYDRQVPLILVGRNFKPGIYNDAKVIDLAPTLSFTLGILAPAMNEGRVLKEILR